MFTTLAGDVRCSTANTQKSIRYLTHKAWKIQVRQYSIHSGKPARILQCHAQAGRLFRWRNCQLSLNGAPLESLRQLEASAPNHTALQFCS